ATAQTAHLALRKYGEVACLKRDASPEYFDTRWKKSENGHRGHGLSTPGLTDKPDSLRGIDLEADVFNKPQHAILASKTNRQTIDCKKMGRSELRLCYSTRVVVSFSP